MTASQGDPPRDPGPGQDGPPPDDWTVLSVPVDGPPPGRVATAEDRAEDGVPSSSASGTPAASGPPGGRIFSLEDRPAPGLYLVAWLLGMGGLAVLFVTTQAAPSAARTIAGLAAILAVGVGLAAAAGYQVVARRDRDAGRYRGPSPLILFGIVLVLSTLASGVLSGTGLLVPSEPVGFLLGLLLVAVSYAVTVWLFAVRSGALTWRGMGWPVDPGSRVATALRDIGTAALVILPVTFGLLLLGGVVALLLDVQAPRVLPTPTTSAEALAVALAASIVAPVGEELFFRGFALSAWLRDLPERTALLRSAGFFALVHIANIQATTFREGAGQAVLQLAVILPLGIVLGWLFLRRGIVAAIAGHVTYNSLLLLLLFLAPTPPSG